MEQPKNDLKIHEQVEMRSFGAGRSYPKSTTGESFTDSFTELKNASSAALPSIPTTSSALVNKKRAA